LRWFDNLKLFLSRRDIILIALGFNPGIEKEIFYQNPVGVQHRRIELQNDEECEGTKDDSSKTVDEIKNG